MFKGTRVPVYGIAEMLKAGASKAEILQGYPSLDAEKLDFAERWVIAHPRTAPPTRLANQGVEPTSIKRVRLQGDPLTGARSVR